VQATLTQESATDYSFRIEASGTPALPDKLPVRLMVGPAFGRTMVKPVRP
jgi:hypothetical protein